MAEQTHLKNSDQWVTVLENHADGYSAMVFAIITINNVGECPILYSSHLDSPELSHSKLRPGCSVTVISRHLLARPDQGDGIMEIEVGGLTAITN